MYVGMNRPSQQPMHGTPRVPHVRGDEPTLRQTQWKHERLPHVLGIKPNLTGSEVVEGCVPHYVG